MSGATSEAEAGALPIDLTAMRQAADWLPAECNGTSLPDGNLENLRLQLRGHLERLIPAVEAAADRLPPDARRARTRAQGAVFVARAALQLGRGDTRLVRISVARKAASSVRALCSVLERLDAP